MAHNVVIYQQIKPTNLSSIMMVELVAKIGV